MIFFSARIPIIFIFCVSVFFGTTHAKLSLDVSARIEMTRQALEKEYYDLVTTHYFDQDPEYNNNRVIAFDVTGNNFESEAAKLFRLIDWLEPRHDQQAQVLLKKLNKYIYLEFCHWLHRKDYKLFPSLDLLSSFQDFYKYKVTFSDQSTLAPFRSLLSRLIISLFAINESYDLSYEKKKENFTQLAEKIRQELSKRIERLDESKQEKKELKKVATEMSMLLSMHAIDQPLVGKGRFTRWIVLSVVGVLGATGIAYVYKKGMGNLVEDLKRLKRETLGSTEDTLEEVAETLKELTQSTRVRCLKRIEEVSKLCTDIENGNQEKVYELRVGWGEFLSQVSALESSDPKADEQAKSLEQIRKTLKADEKSECDRVLNNSSSSYEQVKQKAREIREYVQLFKPHVFALRQRPEKNPVEILSMVADNIETIKRSGISGLLKGQIFSYMTDEEVKQEIKAFVTGSWLGKAKPKNMQEDDKVAIEKMIDEDPNFNILIQRIVDEYYAEAVKKKDRDKKDE
ncbi:MAG: hypothetical protein H6679_01680 [Epsilonproteobacteria bacterium]|nr:hypothetical protein [Campylobacterota bacterium]